jgi:hypothetical protein
MAWRNCSEARVTLSSIWAMRWDLRRAVVRHRVCHARLARCHDPDDARQHQQQADQRAAGDVEALGEAQARDAELIH